MVLGRISRRGLCLGNVKVPDPRVDFLASVYQPKKTTYAEITFVDVAGGGGDQKALTTPTLEAMKQADLLVLVLRCFDSPVLGQDPDPRAELARFQDEFLLHDLAIVERRVQRLRKEQARGPEREALERCLEALEQERPLRELELSPESDRALSGMQLLSRRPLFLLANMDEAAWEDPSFAPFRADALDGLPCMALMGAVEAELAELDPEEQAEFLEGYGISEPSSARFLRRVYQALDLVSFLTAGEDECRAWTIRRGTPARKAAGRIHSDIERGFIRAEVMTFEDFQALGSEAAVKKAGRFRVEGRDYPIQDGEIVHFRFNV